jgi:hypothetical protein
MRAGDLAGAGQPIATAYAVGENRSKAEASATGYATAVQFHLGQFAHKEFLSEFRGFAEDVGDRRSPLQRERGKS